MHVKDRIKEIRDKNKLSNVEMGKLLGVHNTTIGYWMVGKTIPPKARLKEMIKVFKLPQDYFVGLDMKKLTKTERQQSATVGTPVNYKKKRGHAPYTTQRQSKNRSIRIANPVSTYN